MTYQYRRVLIPYRKYSLFLFRRTSKVSYITRISCILCVISIKVIHTVMDHQGESPCGLVVSRELRHPVAIGYEPFSSGFVLSWVRSPIMST